MTTIPTFDEMDLSSEVRDAIAAMGFTQPTPVQSATFETVRAGRDVVAQSQTGTGKTAAFCLPVADKLDTGQGVTQMLVLAPTRELAAQVGEEMGRITANLAVRITPIYGGTSFGPQIEGLRKGSHVVVGTPGRVLDHLRRGNLKLDDVRVFVLDEADEMLSMGFKEELEAIMEYLPGSRQTLLFSATMPPEIKRMIDRHLNEPELFMLSADNVAADEVTHYYYITSHMRKADTLVKILQYEQPDSAIIFCNTRDDASFVTNLLQNRGFDAMLMSGELTQKQREKAMKRIKAGNLRYLVATDVAARGIDISDLSHVFNYALPSSPDMYVHRTGRTGRAGQSGTAISIVSGLDIGTLYQLTNWMKIKLEEREIPTQAQVRKANLGHTVDELIETASQAEVDAELLVLAERVLDADDPKQVVAWLLAERERLEKAAAESAPRKESPSRSEPEESDRDERRSRGDRDRKRDRKRGRDDDRGRSRERGRDRKRREKKARRSPDDAKTIVLHFGRKSKISRNEIREFVAEHGDIDDDSIYDVRWKSGLAFVDVPPDKADELISAIDGKEAEGHPIKCEHARPRGSKNKRGDRKDSKQGSNESDASQDEDDSAENTQEANA